MTKVSTSVSRWIKTECGRAKFAELAARSGPLARLRLGWFVLFGALRDWQLPDPDRGPTGQESSSDS
jgi:hypothetical protein